MLRISSAILILCCAPSLARAADFAEATANARPANDNVIYRAQLLPPISRPADGTFELPGAKVAAKTGEKGRLKIDTRGRGVFRTLSRPGMIPVKLKREDTSKKLTVTLAIDYDAVEKRWTLHNATVLNITAGKDKFIVVDANGNGVYNEPGVDGLTWSGHTYIFPLPKPGDKWCSLNREYTGLSFGPWGEDVKLQSREIRTAVPDALGVLQGINDERVKLGLTPRAENAALSADLQKHCRYMNTNGKLQHPEDPGTPGYSPEGHAAGMRSILSVGTAPRDIALMMVTTYFHRLDVIRPNTIGFGCGYQGRYGGIDGRSDLDKTLEVRRPILCPAPGQTGMPVHYAKESPDATPGDDSAGYPITAYFGTRQLKLTSYSLKAIGPAGKSRGPSRMRAAVVPPEIPCYEFAPGVGPHAGFTASHGAVCIIPKDALAAGTRHEVTLNVDVDGESWTRTWRFDTGKSRARGGRRRR